MRSTAARALPLLAALCLFGCSSARLVAVALRDAPIDLPIDRERVRAAGVWRPSESGHGLEIRVLADREASEYERNLELELNGAARVCAALAGDDRVREWAYVDLYFSNRYRRPPGPSREIVGVVEVIVRRETFVALRERNAPPEEYPRHWRFVGGHKDQPDSKETLSW